MRSHLVEHFRRRRCELGWELSTLARRIGCRSLAGGCNKLQRFEQRGEIHAELLLKTAAALDVDRATIDTLIEQDRRAFLDEWNRWADEPIVPHLIVPRWPYATRGRWTSYRNEPLPGFVASLSAAERYAARIAWACGAAELIWSRRLTVWFNSCGQESRRIIAAPDERSPARLLPGVRPGLRLAAGDVYLCLIGWPPRDRSPSTSIPTG